MFLAVIICDFFFDGDPELILTMFYIIFWLVGSFLKVAPYPPPFAPHLLDMVARENVLSTATAANATGAIPLVNKFCGNTIGETAATCGMALAWECYWHPLRQKQTVGAHYKRELNAFLRYHYFMILGKLLNWLDDIERGIAYAKNQIVDAKEKWVSSEPISRAHEIDNTVVTEEAAEEIHWEL